MEAGSADTLLLVFRFRWLGGNRGLGTPLFESAFVAVGLKCGSGKRRIRATLRFSRRARCPHRAVLGRPGVPPLRRESKPDSASGTGDREGRSYGFTRAYLKPWRAGEDTRPYGVFSTGNVCSVNPGAVVEPHQRKFMQTQGPVARREFRPATQILRAGNALPGPRGNPRKRGSRGWAAWRQGRQRRSCRLRPPLGGSLVPFCPCRKELAAGAAKLFL